MINIQNENINTHKELKIKRTGENGKKRYDTGKYIFKKPNKFSQKRNQKIYSFNKDQNKYGTGLNSGNKNPFIENISNDSNSCKRKGKK